MGKKRRIKKNNLEKLQGHDQVDNPRITIRDLDGDDGVDIITSLHDELLHQILPFLLHKWKHQEQKHDLEIISRNNAMDPNDFISRLPNNILYHIISLLPFEYAIRTTLLSTQWRHLWKEALLTLVPDATMEDAMNAIPSFLEDFNRLHQPRNNWGFRFEFGHGRDLLATVAPNDSLQLDFSAGKQEFPRPFDCLLELNCPWPYTFKYWTREVPCPKKVKSLYLVSVSYASNEAISSMVSSLPFLESLTIKKCYGLRSLHIKKAERLQKLVVLDCPQLQSLSFEGSVLTSFGYRGRLLSVDQFEVYPDDVRPRFWYFMSQYPDRFQLKDAMLDFRHGPPLSNNFNRDGFKLMLQSIKNVKSLTLCRWVFEALISWVLPSLSKDSEFSLYELRELWWIDCSMEKENVNVLLSFLKLCPNLERLYVTIDPKSYNMTSTKKFSAKERLGKAKLDDLKFLKLEGFANEKKEIFFANRLKPLFRMRPLILAKSKGTCLRRLVKVPELERQGKHPYKFKEVKNSHETCLDDHVHMNL